MPLLSELIGIRSLRLRRVVDSGRDPDLRWVATSELVDPTPHLEGGELLLLTGLAAVDWDAEWHSFVERLARHGVHAVGFGTGLSHARVPDALASAARAHGIDVVEVPRAIPFIAVGRAVADLLAASERAALTASVTVQRELTAAIVGSGGLHRVLELLAGETRGSVLVVDARGETLDAAGTPPSAAVAARVRESVAAIRARGIRGSAVDSGPAGDVIVHPLGLTDPPSRYLAVSIEHAPSAAERNGVTIAAALLSLDAERAAREDAGARDLRERAVSLILDGQTDAAQTLLEISGADALPARVRVVRVLTGDPAGAVAALHGAGLAAAGAFAAAVVAVVPESRLGDVAALLPGDRIGIGTRVELQDATTSDAAAASALALTSELEPVIAFDAITAQGVLGTLDRATLAAFADATLRPLGDEPDGDELLETLQAFLARNGARQPTADQLGVHRNTLRNRLGRVERLLGRDLDDPAARVDLWVALRGLPSRRETGDQ